MELAEELLRQLMVTDRTKLEAEAEFDVDEVLLKLNLVGIRALITRDLRCCDCLNYFAVSNACQLSPAGFLAVHLLSALVRA